MRTLLIVPTHLYRSKYPSFLSVSDFPVGFAYLASALEVAGHEVRGLNPNNDPTYGSAPEMVRAKIEAACRDWRPDLVCMGGLCTDYPFLKDAMRWVRQEAPHTPVVLGGGIVSHDAEFIMRTLRPDFCLSGEAEESLVQLAQTLATSSRAYDRIPNLGYWQDGGAVFTPVTHRYADLDSRAFPNYEVFGVREMLDQYSLATRYLYRYSRRNPRPMTLVTGRGCPFSCTFCVHQRGGKYRARGLNEVMREIGQMHDRYQFNVLILLDELFAVNKSRLREFSERVLDGRRNRGWDFDWTFQTHASASFDRETLLVAREAGCYFFSYGLESASPRVLASMNKRSKPAQIVQAIQDAEAARVGFGGNFIFGDPAESAETVKETMGFFRDHCRDIHIYFGWIRPYPGSRLFDQCLAARTIPDKLQYYERIDEVTYNMTSGPRSTWVPWFVLLGYFGNLFLWVKTVPATSIGRLPELDRNPMARAHGTAGYEIGATCPFCRQPFVYRDFLGSERIKQAVSTSWIASLFFRGVARFKRSRWFVRLFFLGVRLVGMVNPLFRHLFLLRDPANVLVPSLVTGCPNCNKRVRILLGRTGAAGDEPEARPAREERPDARTEPSVGTGAGSGREGRG